jgi:hypothetical protein
MLIGDSNLASLVPGLIKYLGRDRIVERVANGCIPSKNFERDFCRQAINAGLNEIHSIKPNLIILGGYYVKHQDLLEMGKLLENELKSYRDKIIVLGPLPRWHDDGLPSKLLKSYNLNPLQPKLPFRLEASPDSFELDTDLRKLSLKWQVSYLSPVKTFCKNRLCLVRLGNKPWEITSYDIVHFTHSASNFLVEKNLF